MFDEKPLPIDPKKAEDFSGTSEENLVKLSEEYADEPVVFIAVNSGNSKQAVGKYLKSNKVPWPAIVDSNRKFEEACGLREEISLDNIHQVRFVTADGNLRAGSFSNLRPGGSNPRWGCDSSHKMFFYSGHIAVECCDQKINTLIRHWKCVIAAAKFLQNT